MPKTYKIYALTDENGKIRYVGITRRSLKDRLCRHIADRHRQEQNYRTFWLRDICNRGFKPGILLIEETDDPARESFWIKWARERGDRLTNCSDGCESHIGYIPPQSTRDAISRAKRGKPISKSHREALRRSLIGRPVSQKTLDALAKYNATKTVSPETRVKISLAHKGRSNWSKGIPKPLQQRQKISLSLTGKRHSEATKLKMSLALRGRPSKLKGKPWSLKRILAQKALSL